MKTAQFYFFIALMLLNFTSSAQQNNAISGRIIDSESQKPIPHVEVFISGTTVGCITDTAGIFQIKPPYFPCTLVADHIAYESFVKPLEHGGNLLIDMRPSNYSLHEIAVSGKDRRKRNLRFFYSHFIKENRDQIKILNDSALIFQRDKMQFIARTNEPLLLINDYLGYKIKVILDEFKVYALDGPNGKPIPLNSIEGGEVMQMSGYYFYEPLEMQFPDKRFYYTLNRQTSYYGSYRHFLKSIYDENLGQQGYEIEVIPNDIAAAFFRLPSNGQNNDAKQYTSKANSLKVHYYFNSKQHPVPLENIEEYFQVTQRTSIIYPTGKPFFIRKNGTSPQLPLIIEGGMEIKNFANTLPEDYIPPKK
ncbi:carboxypeptidase-like regulatory domain-containing protein [uncultured Draconibacterium sp.]|uniref:carboxypeptidase-like regulatory domain-containing protein n=1 Tax=uncultured Draconibacterium sp. TaxID=1573823 RepID=UPI003216A5EA